LRTLPRTRTRRCRWSPGPLYSRDSRERPQTRVAPSDPNQHARTDNGIIVVSALCPSRVPVSPFRLGVRRLGTDRGAWCSDRDASTCGCPISSPASTHIRSRPIRPSTSPGPAPSTNSFLVDETHRRKAVPAHGAQQFAREFLEAGHIVSHHTCRSGRQADRQTLLPRSALGEAYEEALRRRAVAHPPRAECAASDSYACVECMTS
jgi:hypothetical protein